VTAQIWRFRGICVGHGQAIRLYDPEFEPTSAERIARNDATFREANERIKKAAESVGVTDETVPFICECADPGCHDLVGLTLPQYAEVREKPTLFLNVPGHEASARGWAQVVEERDGYVIVAKVGVAADVVTDLATDQSDLVEPRAKE
jgi:hypothetical protein